MRWLDDLTDSMDMSQQALGVGDGKGSLAILQSMVLQSRTRLSD